MYCKKLMSLIKMKKKIFVKPIGIRFILVSCQSICCRDIQVCILCHCAYTVFSKTFFLVPISIREKIQSYVIFGTSADSRRSSFPPHPRLKQRVGSPRVNRIHRATAVGRTFAPAQISRDTNFDFNSDLSS